MKQYDDNLRDIAKSINKNESYLYDIMNHRRSLSFDIFEKICTYYNVSYNNDISFYDYGYNLIINITEAFIKKEYSIILNYRDEYITKRRQLINSKGFAFVPLIDLSLCFIYRCQTYVKESVDKAALFMALYDDNISYAFFVYYVYTNPIINNIDQVGRFIEHLSKHYSLEKINPYLRPMVYFHIGDYYDLTNDLNKSLLYFNKSIDENKDLYLIERVLQVKTHLAILVGRRGQNQSAINLLNEVLEVSLRKNYTVRVTKCYNNLSYMHFLLGNYKQSMEYIHLSKQVGTEFESLAYYETLNTYYIDGKDKALEVIKEYINNVNEQYTLWVLALIDHLLNERYYKFKQVLTKVENYTCLTNDYVEMDLIYSFIINHLKTSNNQPLLVEMLQKYFDFKQKRF